MDDNFYTTSIFEKNITAYNSNECLIINQGGTRSSKTWSILQLLFLIALFSKKKLIISVVSRALPHLKLGAIRDFDKILISYGINPDSIKNKTENYYKLGNSVIEFFGADQKDKVHGPSRNILFINEANFIKYEIYEQLEVRTSGTIFIDFNPTQRFWVHDELIKSHKHIYIKSTYKDNDRLNKQIVARIEAKKNKANWWRVYGEGEIGHLEGAIFTNWHYGEFDATLPYKFGLDFGYYPDPDCLVKIAINNKSKKIYIDENLYESLNGTKSLIKKLKHRVKNNEKIIADSASPRTINDIQQEGLNIIPVSKTKTVSDWLRKMQDYEIIITENSFNIELELQNYVWDDKKAGIPIDAWNHGIDPMRYVFMDTFSKLTSLSKTPIEKIFQK